MFDKIADRKNIELACDMCIKNKRVKERGKYIKARDKIINKAYEYVNNLSWQIKYNEPFKLYEKGKEREIICCTFVDRVIQQAILLQCEGLFERCMIKDSYQAQKGKGIHKASLKIRSWIKMFKKEGDVYFLHLDIKKYYHSIDPKILLDVLSKKIKCKKTLKLFDILFSGDVDGRGVGITLGNNISQWMGNMYLYDYDHLFSSVKNVKYLRYADDMIFLSNDKDKLHKILTRVKRKIYERNLKLSIKCIGKITDKFCLDTLGYRFFINKVLVRKRSKNNLSKAYNHKKESIPSIIGHIKWCNSKQMVKNIRRQNNG